MPKRCVFAACGPTAVEARPHAYWGDLVTLNRALELFPRVKLACFGTPGKVFDTRKHLHLADQLMPLFELVCKDPNAPVAMEILRESQRLLQPPVVVPIVKEGKGDNRQKIWRSHIAAGHVLGRAAIAVVQLAALGYDTFWLFGHDAGYERARELGIEPSRRGYDKSRYCLEEQLKHMKLRYAFWPNPAPGD